MKQPDMDKLERLRAFIANHLAEIASQLDGRYSLTLVGRIAGEPDCDIIVTDASEYSGVIETLQRADTLITVEAKI